ncbi:unnamed protein product [Phaeothamnion confervicola]
MRLFLWFLLAVDSLPLVVCFSTANPFGAAVGRHETRFERSSPLASSRQTAAPLFSSVKNGENDYVSELLRLFDGDFDNYDQVLQDRALGMTAGEGGGHEHIHCRLRDVTTLAPKQIMRPAGTSAPYGDSANPKATVSATYYFNGDPNVVFRFRLYTFENALPEAPRGAAVVMRLWRLLPAVEARLRANGYRLEKVDWDALDPDGTVAEEMRGCEIYWRPTVRPAFSGASASAASAAAAVQESGAATAAATRAGPGTGAVTAIADGPPLWEGLMGENDDGTWISSQVAPGFGILVKDDLGLWSDVLCVNDRGFGRDGKFIYGNQRGVPYRMRRVTPGGSLVWTMGPEHRPAELFAQKMAAITTALPAGGGIAPPGRYSTAAAVPVAAKAPLFAARSPPPPPSTGIAPAAASRPSSLAGEAATCDDG